MFLDDGENLDDGETDTNNDEVEERSAAVRQSYNPKSTPTTSISAEEGLQIQGIPVSQRMQQNKKVEREKEKGLKSKSAKETKEQKERNDAEHR